MLAADLTPDASGSAFAAPIPGTITLSPENSSGVAEVANLMPDGNPEP